MLSGALLLGREKKIFLYKRIVRVLFPLISWSIVYSIWNDHWSGREFDLFQFIVSVFSRPVMFHLWFIYMMIGIYLVFPLGNIVYLALNENKKMAIYLFCLWLTVNALAVYSPIEILKYFHLYDVLGWHGYFIVPCWVG